MQPKKTVVRFCFLKNHVEDAKMNYVNSMKIGFLKVVIDYILKCKCDKIRI